MSSFPVWRANENAFFFCRHRALVYWRRINTLALIIVPLSTPTTPYINARKIHNKHWILLYVNVNNICIFLQALHSLICTNIIWQQLRSSHELYYLVSNKHADFRKPSLLPWPTFGKTAHRITDCGRWWRPKELIPKYAMMHIVSSNSWQLKFHCCGGTSRACAVEFGTEHKQIGHCSTCSDNESKLFSYKLHHSFVALFHYSHQYCATEMEFWKSENLFQHQTLVMAS